MMLKQTMLALLGAVAVGISLGGSAKASHFTTGISDYKGHIHEGDLFEDITFDEGADWWELPVIAGKEITVQIDRGDMGNLVPNFQIYDGIADLGNGVSGLGLLASYRNSSSPFLTAQYTPTNTGLLTGIVSTWLSQTGTYDISCTGCGHVESVPEPSSLLGLAVIGTVAARGALKKKLAA